VEVCALIDPDDLKPARLNTQLILVLSSLIDDAFPIFDELVQKEVSDFCYAVERLAVDPIPALRWIPAEPEDSCGSGPPEIEAIRHWLRCGASVGQDPYMYAAICNHLQNRLLHSIQDCHLTCPDSVRRRIVMDPTQQLPPGHAILKLPDKFVEGPLVVARNPCNLPSDVQVFMGVDGAWLEETHRVQGVLVLSAHASCTRCPAQLLSGGDYDGDDVFVCWWPTLVEKIKCETNDARFTSVYQPPTPKKVTLGAKTLGCTCILQRELEASCAHVVKSQNRGLGSLTMLWQYYADHQGTASHNAVYLAMLCREAVDCEKSGWVCPDISDLLHGLPINLGAQDLSSTSVRGRLHRRTEKNLSTFLHVVERFRPLHTAFAFDPARFQWSVQNSLSFAAFRQRHNELRAILERPPSPAANAAAEFLLRALELKPGLEMVRVPVLALRWTQESINRRMVFRNNVHDGVSVYFLIHSLLRHMSVDLQCPCDLDQPLLICVFSGCVWSLSNRRLTALMAYQALRPDVVVTVPCRVSTAFKHRFRVQYSTKRSGLGIGLPNCHSGSCHIGVQILPSVTTFNKDQEAADGHRHALCWLEDPRTTLTELSFQSTHVPVTLLHLRVDTQLQHDSATRMPHCESAYGLLDVMLRAGLSAANVEPLHVCADERGNLYPTPPDRML